MAGLTVNQVLGIIVTVLGLVGTVFGAGQVYGTLVRDQQELRRDIEELKDHQRFYHGDFPQEAKR